MKIRQQVARPCEKKGMDNYRLAYTCECLATCDKLKGFLKPDSAGTINHKNNSDTIFNGCLDLEDFLIKESLIRYESREYGGLEVLFEGIESIQNLNAELFNDDYLDGEDRLSPIGLASFCLDSIGNKVMDVVDNDERLSKGRFTNESSISYFPETLGYTQAISNTLAIAAPKNLQESFFLSLYTLGEFDKDSDDLQNLATCFIHGIDTEDEMRKIWPRYTEDRLKKLEKAIWTSVFKKMPWWAKRFNKIWTKLSEPQIEALTLEWFYEGDEKPSQLDNAKKLGISVDSYQERLHWAYRKIEELYPEFKRIKRRKPIILPPETPAPLYLVLPNGDKIEIPHPVKKDKIISSRQRIQIRQKTRE